VPPWVPPSLSSQHAPNLAAFAAGGEIKGTSRVETQHGTARNALGRAAREFRTKGARCTDGSIHFPPLPPPDRHGPRRCGTNNGTTLQEMTPRRHYTSGQHITSVFKAAILKAPAAPPPSSTSIPSPRRHECFLGLVLGPALSVVTGQIADSEITCALSTPNFSKFFEISQGPGAGRSRQVCVILD
jgi:hypothetical protein